MDLEPRTVDWSLTGSDAAQVVDDVPDLGGGHPALHRLHVELRTDAVADVGKDLRIRRAVLPFRVTQVRRMDVLGGERAVTRRVLAVAGLAVFLKQLRARRDRFWSGRHRGARLAG